MIRIRYNGDLAGGVRPRIGRHGMYYTKKQLDFRTAVRQSLENVDWSSLKDAPLRVEMHAFYPAPKSQKEAISWKYTRPDVDNLLKPVYDSIFQLHKKREGSKRWDDGLVAPIDIDDSRIVQASITKYSTHDERLLGFVMTIENIDSPAEDMLECVLRHFYTEEVLNDYRRI